MSVTDGTGIKVPFLVLEVAQEKKYSKVLNEIFLKIKDLEKLARL